MASKPVFEHRHYKRIAAIIAEMNSGQPIYHGELVEMFAERLAGTNPAFNRDRFIAAASGNPSNGRDKVRS